MQLRKVDCSRMSVRYCRADSHLCRHDVVAHLSGRARAGQSGGNNLTRLGSCVPTMVKMASFGSSVNRPRSTTSFARSHDVSSTAGSDTVSSGPTSSAAWVNEAVGDVEGVGTDAPYRIP